MVLSVVEGAVALQGTVSGTDSTTIAMTDPVNNPVHTAPNVVRVWIENIEEIVTASGHLQNQIDTIGDSITETAILGADGITIISGSNIVTVSGFRSEFISASGSLQSQIDSINVDEIEPAIVGVDGITVISGSNETTVSGFRSEFVATSGSLQSQVDGIDSSVTLQEAYDNGDGTITTSGGKPFLVDGAGIIQVENSFQAPSGTAAAPSYTFSNGTDTGFAFSQTPFISTIHAIVDGIIRFNIEPSRILAVSGGNSRFVGRNSIVSPAFSFEESPFSGLSHDGVDGGVLFLGVGGDQGVRLVYTDPNDGIEQTELGTQFTSYVFVNNQRVRITRPLHLISDAVVSGSMTVTGTVSADRGEFTNHLSVSGTPVNIKSSDEIEPAILGVSGITVISGTDSILVSGTADIENEPTGFENRTDSSISFTESTREFSIQPTNNSFSYWITGQQYIKNSTQSITISDTAGLHFLYFDGETLVDDTTLDGVNILPDVAFTSIVYWNPTVTGAALFAEERHGLVMDWATHQYLHKSEGTRYIDGLQVGNFTVGGSGDLDSHAQFSVTGGTIADEDIEIVIVTSGSPSAQFEQDLTPIAKIPVYYRLNSDGEWFKDSATSFPVKQGVNRIQYNELTGGNWQLTEASNNSYVAMWILASNDVREPIIALLGQREDSNIGKAKDNATWESLELGQLPSPETKLLYRVIFQTATSMSNTPSASIAAVDDFRQIPTSSVGATASADHGALAGLLDDDHPQYIRADGTRPFTGDQSLGGNSLISVNEITAVTGTFTDGITVGDSTTYIYPDEIRSGDITSSGNLTATSGIFEAGGASAPSVSVGEVDTGLYLSSADTLGMSVGGQELLTFSGTETLGDSSVDLDGLLTVTGSITGGQIVTNFITYPSINAINIRGKLNFTTKDGADLSQGVQELITVPTTLQLDGEGVNTNIFIAFAHRGFTKINSTQQLSAGQAFLAENTLRETGAIGTSHLVLHHIGMTGKPAIRVGHDGTSAAVIPALLGFEAIPDVARAAGNTGNTTVDVMAGYSTNFPNLARVVFGGQQIKPGFTINKYAHFIAHSNVTNGLLQTGGTLTEEVGLDLQEIGVGDTTISVRSTATDAYMTHRGRASFGTNNPPEFSFGGSVQQVTFLVSSNNSDIRDFVIAKYDGGQANHIVFARANGSESNPQETSNSTPIYSIQSWGHDGTQFVHTSTINAEPDNAGSVNKSTAFEFKNRRYAGGNVQTSAYLRSNATFVLYGRHGFPANRITTDTLTSDENNYDAEAISGTGGVPDPMWKLTADSTDRTITGILPPDGPSKFDCQVFSIHNEGASNSIILAHENTNSLASHRIRTPTGQDYSLGPDEAATLWYDTLDDRWRILSTNNARPVEMENGFFAQTITGSITLVQSAPFNFQIRDFTAETDTGTVSGTIKIEGTDVEGINNQIWNNVESTSTASSANTVSIGDKVVLAVSGTSNFTGFGWTMSTVRL